MVTRTRQEVVAEYLIIAEGMLAMYRGKDLAKVYPQLQSELHETLSPYSQEEIDLMELKLINLEIVQKVQDAKTAHFI